MFKKTRIDDHNETNGYGNADGGQALGSNGFRPTNDQPKSGVTPPLRPTPLYPDLSQLDSVHPTMTTPTVNSSSGIIRPEPLRPQLYGQPNAVGQEQGTKEAQGPTERWNYNTLKRPVARRAARSPMDNQYNGH